MNRALQLSAPFLALAAALTVASCKHTPEQTASNTPPVNDLPEVQPVQPMQPQTDAMTGAGTGTPIASASPAREPCDTGSAPARYADANSDGKVTREEAKADPNLVAVFDRFDQNKDGVLDRDEFQKVVDDSQQRHPNRAEFARAEAGSEPCAEQEQKEQPEPRT